MKRLLAYSRAEYKGENPVEIDRAGYEACSLEILKLWTEGNSPLQPPIHLQKTIVRNKEGDLIGFNYYVASQEPMSFGKLKVEVDENFKYSRNPPTK